MPPTADATHEDWYRISPIIFPKTSFEYGRIDCSELFAGSQRRHILFLDKFETQYFDYLLKNNDDESPSRGRILINQDTRLIHEKKSVNKTSPSPCFSLSLSQGLLQLLYLLGCN
mmetsp:Transcript_9102/g.21663  ORF Transcript_9102/g.21663 Transcript_9102/m.21663 type:complete len:115 (-) Transcript_9102:1049-1393(-)